MVEPFDRGGYGAGLDDARYGVGGCAGSAEAAHQAARYRRDRAQRHGGLGEDSQRALRTDEDAQQVGAVVVGAQVDYRAVGEHDFDVDHVVVGDAVFESVWAAGVFDDIAADRCQVSRHRVRREAQAVRGALPLKVDVDDARLNTGCAGAGIDVKNPVHCRQVEQHPAEVGHHRTSAVRRAAAGDQRDVVLPGDAHDRDDLIECAGPQHQPGGAPETPEIVAVGGQRGAVGEDSVGVGKRGSELLNDAVIKYREVSCGHRVLTFRAV